MPGRKYSVANTKYRYGFNGKENDNDVKGDGNQQDYGMRIYDPRLGRFLSEDPVSKEYPELTPYQFASNTPIQAIDLDGLEAAGVGGGVSIAQLQSTTASHQTGKGFIAMGRGFVSSARNTLKGVWNAVTHPKQTVKSISNALSNPVKVWQGMKSGVRQWGNNLMSEDPNVAGFALGQGFEFGAEMLIPVKGMQGLKSSSMALYEGNKIISNALKDGVSIIVAKSTDDLKYLEAMGAKAMYMGGEGTKGSILISEGASRIQILEEAIHHEQRIQFGDKYFYGNVDKLEVAAQDRLLQIGKKEGWKASEIKEIQKAKSTWQKKVLDTK